MDLDTGNFTAKEPYGHGMTELVQERGETFPGQKESAVPHDQAKGEQTTELHLFFEQTKILIFNLQNWNLTY